ncbi:DUF6351 family protein [Streptomyces sp. M19]
MALLTAPASDSATRGALDVDVVSGRPDTVTGGDALLRVTAPSPGAWDSVRVEVNGVDATAVFVPENEREDEQGNERGARARTRARPDRTGLVRGLHEGGNDVTVTAPGARTAG